MFEVVRRLGAGGMGIVFEVIDQNSGSRFALKTLKSDSPDALVRFKREFRALQGITHPNLIGLSEFFVDENNDPFFTMELVDGGDFVRAVANIESPRVRPTSWEESTARNAPYQGCGARRYEERLVRDAFAQLSRGLIALHRFNRVHRDIKPSNVLVDREGRVVILDFGLVTETDPRLQSTGNGVVGSAAYMAPEQAAARQVGPAADWYAAGVLLYEALTGVVPFDGTTYQVLLRKQTDAPKAPRERSDVPDDLDALCLDLLSIDPSRRPTGEEVLRRLGTAAPRRLPQLRSSFVGRVAQLAQLTNMFDRIRSRAPACVVIQGESGIGKTALVEHFLETLPVGEALILEGRCYERETVPFKAIDGALDTLARHMRHQPDSENAAVLPRDAKLLGEIFPALRQVKMFADAPSLPVGDDPLERRSRVFQALREMLVRMTDRQSVVVVIDDLQWADDDSFVLLRELLNPPDPPPVLLIGTSRRKEPRMHELGAETLVLEGLSSDDARELAANLLAEKQTDTGVAAAVIADESRGHPLFIAELVRHAAEPREHVAPLRLDEAIAIRATSLSEVARRVLDAIVIAGTPVAIGAIAAATHLDEKQLSITIKQLCADGLAKLTGRAGLERVEAFHDRVREAVFGRMDANDRQQWHRHLAEALNDSPDIEPEVLAAHWQAAGDPLRAVEYAIRAATQNTDALAFDRAVSLYRLALQLSSESDGRRRDLRLRLADALSNAGRGVDAAVEYCSLIDGATEKEALNLRVLAAQQYLFSGHLDEGYVQLSALKSQNLAPSKSIRSAFASALWRRALLRIRGASFRERKEADIEPETLTRIDMLHRIAMGLGMIDYVRGAAFHAQSLRLALKVGEPIRVARSLALASCFAIASKDLSRARELASTAIQKRPDQEAIGIAIGGAGMAAFQQGRWRKCLELCDRSTKEFAKDQDGVNRWIEIATARFFAMWSLAMLGNFSEIERRLPNALLEAEQRGNHFVLNGLRTRSGAFLWLVHDRPEMVRLQCTDEIARWSSAGIHLQHWLASYALAEVDFYEGSWDGLVGRMTQLWQDLKSSYLHFLPSIWIEASFLLGKAAIATCVPENTSKATRLAKLAIRRLRRKGGVPVARAYASVVESGLASLRGDRVQIVVRLREALSIFVDLEMDLFAACTRNRLSALIDAPESEEMFVAASAYFKREKIKNIPAMTRTLVPLAQGAS